MDREKLDLMLSLNGRPTPNLFQGELVLRQQIYKMDCLMKEQGSSLLEERSLLKAEWDRDRRCSENMLKSLRLKYDIAILNCFPINLESLLYITEFRNFKTNW